MFFQLRLDNITLINDRVEERHFRLGKPAPGVNDRQRAGQDETGCDDPLARTPRRVGRSTTVVSVGNAQFSQWRNVDQIAHVHVIRPPAWPISTGSLFPQLHSTSISTWTQANANLRNL